jgi:uncharacterized RDD family membrane protein YckC
VSAYQFPEAAPAYATPTADDPTAVIGRRIGAWVVDLLLYALIMAFVAPTPLSPLAEYFDTDENPGVTCEQVQDLEDVSSCVEIGDRLYFTETGDALIQFAVFVLVVLLYSALQGATGVTPGKALFGVKVVDEQGGRPGFGKSILRTVLWAVDGAPWCLPLVGLITGLTTKGHRRVGDMAAKTFVVGKAHTGPVRVPGLATVATGGYPGAPGGYGGQGQTWGAPPQGAAGGPTGGWGAPPPPGGQPGDWGPPSGGFPPAGTEGTSGRPTTGAPWPEASPTGSTSISRHDSGEHRPAPPAGWTPPGGEPGPPSSPAAPTSRPSSRPDSGDDEAVTPTSSDRPSPPRGTPADADTRGAGAPPSSGGPGAGRSTGPAEASDPASQAAPSGYNPQWDAARGTYIVWEPNRGKWLGWDEAAKEWKPL